MKNYKRILFAFIGIFLIFIFVIRCLLHTDYMLGLLTTQVESHLKSHFTSEFEFKGLEFEFFPPAIIAKDVSINGSIEDYFEYRSEVSNLKVTFGIMDLLSNRVVISSILLDGGNYQIRDLAQRSEFSWNQEEFIQTLTKTFLNVANAQETLEELSVRLDRIDFSNSSFVIDNGKSYFIQSLGLERYSTNLHLTLEMRDLEIPTTKLLGDLGLDMRLSSGLIYIDQASFLRDAYKLSLTGAVRNEEGFPLDMSFDAQGAFEEILPFLGLIPQKSKVRLMDGDSNLKFILSGPLRNPNGSLALEIRNLESPFLLADRIKVFLEKKEDEIYLSQLFYERRGGKLELQNKTLLYNFAEKKVANLSASFHAERLHSNDFLYAIRNSMERFKMRGTGDLEISYDIDENKLIFDLSESFLLENIRLASTLKEKSPILHVPSLHVVSAIERSRDSSDTGLDAAKSLEDREDVKEEKSEGLTLDNSRGDFTGDTSENTPTRKKEFVLDLFNFDLDMDFHFRLGAGEILAKGKLRDEGIAFEIQGKQFDFQKFGKISGVELFGLGDLDMKVQGPFDDAHLVFDIKGLEDFSVLGFHFGEAIGKLDLSLKTLNLSLENFRSEFMGTQIIAKGFLDFSQEAGYTELDLDVSQGSFDSFKSIFAPLVDAVNFPEEIDLKFHYGTSFFIKGPFDLKALSVQGKLVGRNLYFYDEPFDAFNFDFKFADYSLEFANVQLLKSSGKFTGSFFYDLNTNYLEYSGKLADLRLHDFAYYELLKLSFDADIALDFYGNGTPSTFSGRSILNLENNRIDTHSLLPSSLYAEYSNKDLRLSSQILGESIVLDAYLNFFDKKKNASGNRRKQRKEVNERSYLNASVENLDLKTVLAGISEHNLFDAGLGGEVSAILKSEFDFWDFENLDLSLDLSKLFLNYKDFYLGLDPSQTSLNIVAGEFKNSSFRLLNKKKEPLLDLSTKGKFANKFNLLAKYSFDPVIFEVISEDLSNLSGKIAGSLNIKRDKDLSYTFHTEVSDLGFSYAKFPGAFRGISTDISLEDDELILRNAKGNFSGGNFQASGKAKLIFPFPILDFKAEAQNARFDFGKKSYVNLSGKASLSGLRLPYSLTGNWQMTGGEILDNFSDLIPPEVFSTQNKYLPTLGGPVRTLGLFNYNASIETLRPLFIKNNLVDFSVLGEASLLGLSSSPTLSLVLRPGPSESKIHFNNHEFLVKDGEMNFEGTLLSFNPQVYLSSESKVSEYLIDMQIKGPVSDMNLEFSSRPQLTREDIISLLTLGFTTEMGQRLTEEERRAMTSVGIGTFLIDQTGINQSLSSMLGLKFSITSELEEDANASLLDSSSENKGLKTTRVRSTTKLKVQKQLGPKMDMSFSTMLAGSADQKQEMNINYNLDSNLSVQGVYEIKQGGVNYDGVDRENSAGADLIWRWPFK